MRKFRVTFEGSVDIELADQVIDVVDDGWRKLFYPLYTPEEIAGHIAYNLAINRTELSHLDGWADQPDENAKIISSLDMEIADIEAIK